MTNNPEKPALKPCPFCNSTAILEIGWDRKKDRKTETIKCTLPQCAWVMVYGALESHKRWNTRPIEAELQSQIEGYKERLEDIKRLTRELDVAMHGEGNAAAQASLCDLINPALRLRAEIDRLKEKLKVQAINHLNEMCYKDKLYGDEIEFLAKERELYRKFLKWFGWEETFEQFKTGEQYVEGQN